MMRNSRTAMGAHELVIAEEGDHRDEFDHRLHARVGCRELEGRDNVFLRQGKGEADGASTVVDVDPVSNSAGAVVDAQRQLTGRLGEGCLTFLLPSC